MVVGVIGVDALSVNNLTNIHHVRITFSLTTLLNNDDIPTDRWTEITKRSVVELKDGVINEMPKVKGA